MTAPRDAIDILTEARALIQACEARLRQVEYGIPGGHDPDVYERDRAGEAILAAAAALKDAVGDHIAPAITAIQAARAEAEPDYETDMRRQHGYPGVFT